MYTSKAGDDRQYWPDCYRYLCNLDESQLHYAVYGRRHPLAAYNVSVQDLAKEFTRFFRSLDMLSRPSGLGLDSIQVGEVIDAYGSVLYQILEHLEDCQKIATCLFPSTTERDRDHRYKRFLSSQKQCGDLVRRAANAMKHHQNELLPFLLHHSGMHALGYMCAAPNGRNGIGPNPAVHKKFRGRDTCISFNADLRRNFAVIYDAGAVLGSFLNKMDVTPIAASSAAGHLLEVGRRVAMLPHVYFPDEVEKPIPEITVDGPDNQEVLTVAFPGRLGKGYFFPNGARVVGRYSGDGKTNTFTMPYFFA